MRWPQAAPKQIIATGRQPLLGRKRPTGWPALWPSKDEQRLPTRPPATALTARLLQATDCDGPQHAAAAELPAVKQSHLAGAAGGGLPKGPGRKS